MEIKMRFIVSARHSVDKYALDRAEVEVRSSTTGRYYVSLHPFGCSKDYATPTDAIVGLLEDNGCTSIHAEPVLLTYHDAMTLEEGLALARQFDDASVAEGHAVFRIDYDPSYWLGQGITTGKELWDYLEGCR